MPSVDSRPDNLRARTTSGLRWLGGSQVVHVLLQLGTHVALARLLAPGDFGLVGAALVIAGLAGLLAELGVGSAIVQLDPLRPGHLVAAQRTSLLIACLLLAVASAGAAPLAALLGMPRLTLMVPALCCGVMLTPLAVIPRSLLQREMAFRQIGVAEISGVACGSVTSIGCALLGGGAWSLAAGFLAHRTVATLGLRRARPWTAAPGTAPTAGEVAEVRSFGVTLSAASTLNYVVSNVDSLAIAGALGATALGHYTLAFGLMILPTRRLATLLSQITFPAVASLQTDPAAIRRGYVLLQRQLALVVFPAVTGLALVAPEAIAVVYGEKWLPATAALQILCASGVVRALSNPAGAVLCGLGRPELVLWLNLALVAMVAPCAFLAAPHGIEAVALVVTAAYLLVFPLVQGLALRQIDLPWRQYAGALAPALVGTGAMAAAVLLARSRLEAGGSQTTRLFVLVAAGVAVYAAYMVAFRRADLRAVLAIARPRAEPRVGV